MNIRYTTPLTIIFLLLVQGCANNSIESIKSQYTASSCEELVSERGIIEQKYSKYRSQYSEIKSMWDYGNNDYLRMHSKTQEWERNYADASDRLKVIKNVINQKGCSEYYGKVNTKPVTKMWSSKPKPKSKDNAVNITGNWMGTWTSTNGKNGGEASATFIQDDSNLVGLFSTKDSPCLKSGTIEGSVLDSYAKMNISSGEHKIILDAYDVSSKSLKGSYITTKGKCKGSKGDVALIMQD